MSKLNLLYYIKKYGFNSVLFKNMIAIVLCITIPFGIISFIIYRNSAIALKRETEMLSQQRLEKLTQVSDDFIKSMDKLCVVLLQQSSVQKVLAVGEYRMNMSSDYMAVMNLITPFFLTYSYINNISVYSETNDCVITQSAIIEAENCTLPVLTAYPDAAESEIFVSDSNGAGIESVTFMHKRVIGDESLGAVAIGVYISRIFEAFGISVNNESEKLIIVDRNNDILLSSDIQDIGKPLNEAIKVEKGMTKIDEKNYIVAEGNSQIEGLRYLYISDEQIYEYANAKMVQMLYFLIFCVLLLSLLIAFYISAKTFRPLAEIIKYFSRAAETERDTDELGYITRNILMLKNEKIELTEEMQQRIIMMNRAQLQALQGQMNPHFIHNTLEMIKWLIIGLEDDSDSRASDMIEKLSSLIHYSMDMENYLVDINEEIRQTQRFIEILKIRYDGKFNVEWTIDPAISNEKILKLSLQPLIENAMSHGIAPCRRKGTIKIAITGEKDCIRIVVCDNGAGVGTEKLEEIKRRLNGVMLLEGEKIGLCNLNLRVKLVYGEAYGVSIDSVLGKGTRVVVLIGRSNDTIEKE